MDDCSNVQVTSGRASEGGVRFNGSKKWTNKSLFLNQHPYLHYKCAIMTEQSFSIK